MEVTFTPEQSDFVRHAVEAGRLRNSDQAVQEAMTLWVERERRRVELVASLDAAEASLAHGEGRAVTQDSMKTLASDVMERNRRRFAAEPKAGRQWIKSNVWFPHRMAGADAKKRVLRHPRPSSL